MNKNQLFEQGKSHCEDFLSVNDLPPVNWVLNPEIQVNACGFFRCYKPFERDYSWNPSVCIYTKKCSIDATESNRSWSFATGIIDRTPYGVCAHEIGHYLDVLLSRKCDLKVGSYGGNFSILMRAKANEPPITNYCPNDWEWFAEICRLFITNSSLLRRLRPRSYNLLTEHLRSTTGHPTWKQFKDNVPSRIWNSTEKKIDAAKKRNRHTGSD